MKKVFVIVTMVFALCVSAFADKSRFYENGKVIDTMYVDSPEGLRVRSAPSLKSNRICGLTHRLPVKIVAIGNEDTIDGITAPWVEILIPRYEWKSDEPEYGWVFGGYLKEKQPDFEMPKNAAQLEEYLKGGNWTRTDDPDVRKENNHYNFFTKDGKYTYSRTKNYVDSKKAWFFQNYDDDDNQSTWKVVNSHQIKIHWYIPSSTNSYKEPLDETETLEIDVIGEASCYINGIKYLNKPFENPGLRHHWDYFDAASTPLMYKEAYLEDNYSYNIYDAAEKANGIYSDHKREVISLLIKSGVSAKGTNYEKQYHDYWDPIMAEHQKKADAMK